jgi:hypothetical protein
MNEYLSGEFAFHDFGNDYHGRRHLTTAWRREMTESQSATVEKTASVEITVKGNRILDLAASWF